MIIRGVDDAVCHRPQPRQGFALEPDRFGHWDLFCQRVFASSFAVAPAEDVIPRLQKQDFAGETCVPERVDLCRKREGEIPIANIDPECDALDVSSVRTKLGKGGKENGWQIIDAVKA